MGWIKKWLKQKVGKRHILESLGKFLKRYDQQNDVYRSQFFDEYQYSIANTRLVSSRGLLCNCDIAPHRPQSSMVDKQYLASIISALERVPDLSRPVSIYLCSEALSSFAKIVLPLIDRDFVLVSGDSDLPISFQSLETSFHEITGHPRLHAWFAQNRVADHPKLYSLPIGLDFHSRWNNPQIWGGGFVLPALQETELRAILSCSPSWQDRLPIAYCNWTATLDRGDRAECKTKADPRACYYLTAALSRTKTWQEQSSYAFVISPSGAGMDCHRTWEALALGCVPIVKRHPYCDLFSLLPVIIVDDWSEVTAEFLMQQHRLLQNKSYDYSSLLLRSWQARICGLGVQTPLSNIKFDAMRHIFC